MDLRNSKIRDIFAHIEKLKEESKDLKDYFYKIEDLLFLENGISMSDSPLEFRNGKAVFIHEVTDELVIEKHQEISDELKSLYNSLEEDFISDKLKSLYNSLEEDFNDEIKNKIKEIEDAAVKASNSSEDGRMSIILSAVSTNQLGFRFIYEGFN